MKLQAFSVVLAVFVLASCSKIVPYLSVARGNHEYSNGDYQSANIAYINAAKSEHFDEWIAYNLGTVYYALGEVEAAAKEWDLAGGGIEGQLPYLVNFNHGVLLFDRGQYEDAYEKFRNALEINPNGLEAKVNLELCIEKMELKSQEPNLGSNYTSLQSNTRGEIDRIMNYLRRMEGQVWDSTERIDQASIPRDL